MPALTKSPRHLLSLVGLVLVAATGLAVLGQPQTASAAVNVPASVAPADVRQTINFDCNNLGWHVVQIGWISPKGRPGATSMSVPEGTNSVPLQFNWITYRCRADEFVARYGGSNKIIDTSPNISALNGRIYDTPYPGSPGKYRTNVVRSFSYAGNFDSSKTITIRAWAKGTISQSNGYWCALVGGETQQKRVSGLHDFGPCSTGRGDFSIRVNVYPVNDAPTGNIGKVTCTASDGLRVRVTFNDKDGNTRARVRIGTVTKGVPSSPGAAVFSSSELDSYNKQTITLYVKDVGPKADGKFHKVDTKNTRLCVNSKCGTWTMDPSDGVDPYSKFSIKLSIKLSVDQNPPQPDSMKLRIEPIPPATWSYTGEQDTLQYPGGSVNAKFDNIGPSDEAGHYKITWEYTNGNNPGLDQTCGAEVDMDGNTFWIANKPYLSVYGGDTIAGGTQQGGVVGCQIDNNAGIFSWNNDKPDYAGAGGQLGVMALGLIKHFISGFGASNGTSTPAHNSFANTANVGGGTYGGKFGTVPSSCDWIGDAATTGSDPGNTIAGHSISGGSPETYYVTGHDVYISGDIIYNGAGSWNSVDDIPSFKLVVVGGNIYINGTVGELDGLYAAVPSSSGQGGQIVTCATSSGPVGLDSSSLFADCNHQLKVYGSFAAADVEFNRTWKSLGAAKGGDTWDNNAAAEVFVYTPEMWLPNGSAKKQIEYDSIVGLPPVL